jgi:dihydroorotase
MEMPNTNPQTINEKHITDKWNIAEKNSFCNYSFYIGATNENIKDLESANYRNICGVKVFLGSSTGNMLVNDPNILKQIFSISHIPIAIHSEDDNIVKANLEKYKVIHGDDIPVSLHHEIRDTEACYQSTKRAVELAKECNTRLHVLHISTEKELEFFEKGTDYNKKHITSEVCVHHLLFNSDDYSTYGSKIKWNPAIKCKADQESLLKAVNNDLIDIIATDHAPHTIEEKSNSYLKCPSGGPLVQHSLVAMLELYHQNKISIEKIVEKMCHAPARLFKIQDRGYIKKGYWADLTIVDLNAPWQVTKDNILYKCGWSPFEGWTFKSKVTHTFVNGNLIYENGTFNETIKGQRLEFNN